MRRSADIGRPAAVAVLVTAVVALAAPAASPRSQGVEKRRFPSRDWAYALALQRDGKIVAVGRSLGGGWRFALARYTPAGKLDPSFGDSGKVLSDFGSGGTANAVAVQRDGKVVAAGQTWVARPEDVLVRYTPRGHLDPAFGQGGKVLTDFGALATSVATQADGRIVVAGASGRRFALARYTARGRPDASFGRNGEVLTRLGAYAQAQAVAIQQDGKVVAAGSARSGFALARYTARGRPDASFGSGGTVVTKLGSFSRASALAIQPDGKLVAAGTADDFTDFGLVRYTADGKLDPSFGSGGKVVTNIGFTGCCEGGTFESTDGALALAIQRDGKLVAAGFSDALGRSTEQDRSVQNFALVRYTADGKLDPTFGDGGKVLTPFGGRSNAQGVAIQPDGKIVAAGGGAGYFVLARYTAMGKLDPSFGRGGTVQTTLRLP